MVCAASGEPKKYGLARSVFRAFPSFSVFDLLLALYQPAQRPPLAKATTRLVAKRMNIFLPAEDGGEVELSPFAITASLYRGSAPASDASSSSSRRCSTSSVASSASYKTAEDHPGDPPDYSVLEPLLTPKRAHPMRPSLLRFQFCLSDPPKTYYTPTPGGPIHTRTSEHLEVAKRGKEMLEEIIKVGLQPKPITPWHIWLTRRAR